MRQQLANAVAREVGGVDPADIRVSVKPSVPICVSAEVCLPDAAANDAAVAALRKAYATPESAMVLLEASGLHVILTESPAVTPFMRDPTGAEIGGPDDIPTGAEEVVPLEALTAAIRRHTGVSSESERLATQAIATAEAAAKAEEAMSAKAAELASVAADSAATLEAAKAEQVEAEVKAEAAKAAAKEAELAEATAQAAVNAVVRETTKAQLEGLLGDGSTPAPVPGSAAPDGVPQQTLFTSTDPVAAYRKGQLTLDQLSALDRIAVLEADGADAAMIEAEKHQLRADITQWAEDAQALRLARVEEAKAAIATRDLTLSEIKAREKVFAQKMREREEAEKNFYAGTFEQARLDRIEKARRAKVVALEMERAMAKAKADADAKQAEEDAKLAAEKAEEEAAKLKADAELAQHALAAYLASDQTPAKVAAKRAMEPTNCARPTSHRAYFWLAYEVLLRPRVALYTYRPCLLCVLLMLIHIGCSRFVLSSCSRACRDTIGDAYLLGSWRRRVVHDGHAPAAGDRRRAGAGGRGLFGHCGDGTAVCADHCAGRGMSAGRSDERCRRCRVAQGVCITGVGDGVARSQRAARDPHGATGRACVHARASWRGDLR